MLRELFEVLLNRLIALSRDVELVHFHKTLRVSDAVLHAILSQAAGCFAQFVGSALLFLVEASRGLIDVPFEIAYLIGQLVFALAQLLL